MIDPQRPETEPTFEGVYRAHQRDVLRYTTLMLRDPDDAADLTAETFARAFAAWREGRGPAGRPLPWLLVIARRLVLDRWRRRRIVRWLPNLDEPALPQAGPTAASEFWLWLDRLAEALPPRQREVIFLRYRRDLSDQDIGLVMGLSPSGVRSLVARAIAALRDHPELLS